MSYLQEEDASFLVGLAAYLRAATTQKKDIPEALVDLAARIAGCVGTSEDEKRVREGWQVSAPPLGPVSAEAAERERLLVAAPEMAEALEAWVRNDSIPALERDLKWSLASRVIHEDAVAALRKAGRLP